MNRLVNVVSLFLYIQKQPTNNSKNNIILPSTENTKFYYIGKLLSFSKLLSLSNKKELLQMDELSQIKEMIETFIVLHKKAGD